MRKGLWPFIFPNNLRLTEKIYQVNLEKAQKDSQIIDNIDESDRCTNEEVSQSQWAIFRGNDQYLILTAKKRKAIRADSNNFM